MNTKVTETIYNYIQSPTQEVALEFSQIIQGYPEEFFSGEAEILEGILKHIYIPESPLPLPRHILRRFAQKFGEGRPFQILNQIDKQLFERVESHFYIVKILNLENKILENIRQREPWKVHVKVEDKLDGDITYTTLDHELANRLGEKARKFFNSKLWPASLSPSIFSDISYTFSTTATLLLLHSISREIDQSMVDLLSLLVGGYFFLGIDEYPSQEVLRNHPGIFWGHPRVKKWQTLRDGRLWCHRKTPFLEEYELVERNPDLFTKYLFSIPEVVKIVLDHKVLPPLVRRKILEMKIFLSNEAVVKVFRPGKEWEIRDRTKSFTVLWEEKKKEIQIFLDLEDYEHRQYKRPVSKQNMVFLDLSVLRIKNHRNFKKNLNPHNPI